MPSQRKRIGFLPSEEVQKIIDKLCRANNFSQSKVTGLLVEEALRSRGILDSSFPKMKNEEEDYINESLWQEKLANSNQSMSTSDFKIENKKSFSDNIKMMHEFIEFKYFKKIIKQNENIFE